MIDLSIEKPKVSEQAKRKQQDLSLAAWISQAGENVGDLFEYFADVLPMVVAYVDRNQIFRFANLEFKQWFGLTDKEVAGATVKELFGSAAYAKVKPHIDSVLTGELVEFIEVLEFKAGQRIVKARYLPHVVNSEVRGYFGVVADISHEYEIQRRISESIKEKEVLIKEMHHRIKNNLQMMSSLFSIQGRYIDKQDAKALLEANKGRLQILAMIHEHLYKNPSSLGVSQALYFSELVSMIGCIHQDTRPGHRLIAHIDDVSVPTTHAVPIGLIINELLENAYKHAYSLTNEDDDSDKTVKVKVSGDIDKALTVSVIDYGRGIPEQVDMMNPESMGLRLISLLTRQLGGTVDIQRANPTKVSVFLPGEKNAN